VNCRIRLPKADTGWIPSKNVVLMNIMETGDLLHGVSLPNNNHPSSPSRRNSDSNGSKNVLSSQFSAIRSAHEDIDDEEVYFVNGVAQSLSSCGTYAVRSPAGIYIYKDKPEVAPAQLMVQPPSVLAKQSLKKRDETSSLSSVYEEGESLESGGEMSDSVVFDGRDNSDTTRGKKVKKKKKKKKKTGNTIVYMDEVSVVTDKEDDSFEIAFNNHLLPSNCNQDNGALIVANKSTKRKMTSYTQGAINAAMPLLRPRSIARGKGLIHRLRRLANPVKDGICITDSENDYSSSGSLVGCVEDLTISKTTDGRQGPIPIGMAMHRERLQIVEKDGQWLKLARGRGYVGVVWEGSDGDRRDSCEVEGFNGEGKENSIPLNRKKKKFGMKESGDGWSLVKVGGPTDKACKIEWMCKTLCRQSKVLRDEVARLTLLRSVLEDELLKAMAEPEPGWGINANDNVIDSKDHHHLDGRSLKAAGGIIRARSPKNSTNDRYLNYHSDGETTNILRRSQLPPISHSCLPRTTNVTSTQPLSSDNGQQVMETALKCIDFRTGLSGHLALMSTKTIVDRSPGKVIKRSSGFRMSGHLGLSTFSSSRGPTDGGGPTRGGLMGNARSQSACSRMMEKDDNSPGPSSSFRGGDGNSNREGASHHVSFYLPPSSLLE